MKFIGKLLKGIVTFFIVIIVLSFLFSRGDKDKATNVEKENVVTTAETKTSEVKEVATETKKEEDNVPQEWKNAFKKAENYSKLMHMSKKGIYKQLTSEYGEKFPTEAAEYAINNIDVNWNENALEKAYSYAKTMHMSKQGIYDQLVSEHGEQFTEEEAKYAFDNIEYDWNANALEKAKSYQKTMNMSKERIREQLTSPHGEQFTQEEAAWAIENLE